MVRRKKSIGPAYARSKRAKRAAKIAAMPRGGFKRSPDWSFARKLLVRAAEHAVASKTGEGLSNFVDNLDIPKEVKTKVGKFYKTALKAPSPTQNYEHSDEIPVVTTTSHVNVSGGNGTYNAKVHKIHFEAGKRPSRTVRALGKSQGISNIRYYDTLRQYKDQGQRTNLVLAHGFNRRQVSLIRPQFFGYSHEEIANFFSIGTGGDYSTSPTKNQVSYGGIYKLRSQISFMNNAKVLPVNLKVHMVRQKNLGIQALDLLGTIANPTLATQQSGKIPVIRQLADGVFQNPLRTSLATDNTKNGIWTCGNAMLNWERVKTFNVKLAAGDSLEFTYDHWLKSGIQLEKLHAAAATTMISSASFYTYFMIVEHYGPKVELVRISDNDVRYRGTAWGQLNVESKKFVEGIRASELVKSQFDTTTALGYYSNDFAIRTFTTVDVEKEELANRRVFHTSFEDSTYRIPVITDTQIEYAGSKDAT